MRPYASIPGGPTWPASCRALDAEGVKIEHLQLHQPSLDDGFLAKTGRSLEGAAQDQGLAMEGAT